MTNKSTFATNLKRYMALKEKSRKDLATDLGISYYTVTDWVNGKKYPRMDKVEKLAKYFGILKSDLIEEKGNDRFEMQKKNNIQADIVLRMQRDDEFFATVKALHEMDPGKLSGLLALLK